jgi:hypothetical protein
LPVPVINRLAKERPPISNPASPAVSGPLPASPGFAVREGGALWVTV